MDYIIINGIKSTLIKGLLIQSLPSIFKPAKRIETEEIDGRDGDIITELGYETYDRDIEIGLHGDYDIDEIINYFNASGEVIFSNEPDKFYNFTIYEQIEFEKLIRFRTATVTMHVQPFKYSAIEKSVTQNQLIEVRDYYESKNEMEILSQNSTISLSGTAKYNTDIFIPIRDLEVESGSYTFIASSAGTGCESCRIRLIKDTPSNINTFGGTYTTLESYGTVSISADLETAGSFNYVHLYVPEGVTADFSLIVRFQNNAFNEAVIFNIGNTYSRPVMTIYGSGDINLNLNGVQIMMIALGDDEYITIDAEELEAHKDGILKNRNVTGNIDNLIFPPGRNEITWSGNITEIDIEKFSRWI